MLKNYKIKVNGTHPKAYQEILDVAVELGYANEDWGNLYNVNYLFLNDDGSVGFSLNGESVSDDYQELTLPQLRDLVAQSKSTEQGLISGADAKLAWAKGENVQARPKTLSETWEDLSGRHSLDIFEQVISYEFRLKPSTIKLELEIPAPFEPKVGEKYWFIADYTSHGYSDTQEGTGINSSIGKWRSEDEIKQVVAALRGAICKK